MRTTVTLDDDVARLVQDTQHRERKSFKQVVNEALRRGLLETGTDVAPYRVRPHRSGVRAGVEMTALNRLADELEDDELLAGRSP
ncbi:MAG: hypothetical protein V9G19_05810 [Tetrasphaera sp.]